MRRRWIQIPSVLLLTLLLAGAVHAQGVPGTIVQQSPSHLDACNVTATATGAANTAVTVTIPAQAGLFFYVCTVDIFEVGNAAVVGAAGPAPIFTTTNLPVNLVWWGDNATQGTGFQKLILAANYGPGYLKTAVPGTAFTIVTSAGQATQSVRLNVSGYYAP